MTQSLKAKPVRKVAQTKTPVAKRPIKQTVYKMEPSAPTVTKVKTQIKDVYVIEAKDLWLDFLNRMRINNHEVVELFKQTKELINTATKK